MLNTAVTTSPTAYWYLTRGTGTVALILLTLSVVLGVANVERLRTARMPRFVVDAVHRNVSLLAITFLLVHIVTSLLDGYAPIRIVDVVIPFVSAYRPAWLGLGAVALDLMVAVVITSLLRRRFGYRRWRIVHWAAYAAWPVALLHGLGTGSDTKAGWMLVIVAGCVIVMIAAVVVRATAGWPEPPGARVAALAASALVPIGLLVWLPHGPLAAGWSQKAGTPASLLHATTGTAARPTSNSPSSRASGSPPSASHPPSSTASGSHPSASKSTSSRANGSSRSAPTFAANATGTVQERAADDGRSEIAISLSLSGPKLNMLAIRLRGHPLDGGGVQMTSSVVTLGSQSQPSVYRGVVTSLNGANITAQLADRNGNRLTLAARLQINADSESVSGTVSGTP